MAKKTKDSNLSIEERLEQALIPNWDEPYKLPDNWCWTKFSYCSNIRTGKKDANYGSENGEYPFFTCAAEPIRCNDFSFDCYALLLAGNGDIGNISIYNGKFEAYQRTYVVETDMNIDVRYAYYYFKYKWVDYNKDKMFGTAIPYIRLGNLQDFPFPIAPLHEQKRIVKYIDVLFAKLDEAKGKAQEVVDGFESRKAAILHKAFSGELTAKWREKNNISLEDWENKLFDECIGKMQNGLAKRSGNTGIPYVVLRLANLSDDGFITDDLRQIVLDEKEQKSYKLNVDDVIMIRVNGSKDNVAKQILVTEHNPWAFCDHIIRIKYNESVLPEYMVLYSKSETYKIYVKDNIVSSAGQNTISRKGMARLSIPVPTIDEQKEIAKILSEMFAKERRVKETAEAVIEQIDTMKKAILARAFRGDLGTNDPSEESAVELLKQIL